MPDSTCSAPVCERPAKTKGYCQAHYLRTLKGTPVDAPIRARGKGFDSCQMEGCSKAFFAKGMCSMHYSRLRNYGSEMYEPAVRLVTELPPLTCVSPGCSAATRKRALCEGHAQEWDATHPHKRTDPLGKRLAAQTMRTDGCWYWVGNLSHDYYGYFGSKPLGTSRAHRTAWAMSKGLIPEDMQVDHICHTTFCIRLDHLRLATPRMNSDNRKGANRGNKSGYRGVTWSAQMQRWQGRYMVKYVPYDVGYFDDPREAFKAVEAARHETKARLGLIAEDQMVA